MKCHIIILFFSIIFSSINCYSQDIHFSQFNANPMLVNSAFTGNMECNRRVTSDYRTQWNSVTTPYVDRIIYIEGKSFPDAIGDDWLGMGLYINNSVAGDADMMNTAAKGVMAFHKGLLQNNALFVSIGTGLGIMNKSIQVSKLKFDSQWDGYTYNTSQTSGEVFRKYSFYQLDFDIGINATYSPSTKIGIPPYALYLGGAMRHLNRPVNSFFNKDQRLGVAKLVHGGAIIKISSRVLMQPALFFNAQKKVHEFIIGTNALFFSGYTHFMLGAWTRWSRDFIPVVGLEWHKATLAISYDINVSSLKVASNYRGGVEISFTKSFSCAMKRAIASGRNFFQYPDFVGFQRTKY